MSTEKKTVLYRLAVEQTGRLALTFALVVVEDGVVLAARDHNFHIEVGADIDAALAWMSDHLSHLVTEVPQHLASLGFTGGPTAYPPPTEQSVAAIKEAAAKAWTDPVLAAAVAARAKDAEQESAKAEVFKAAREVEQKQFDDAVAAAVERLTKKP